MTSTVRGATFVLLLVTGTLLRPVAAAAQEATARRDAEEAAALRSEIERLDQRLKILERRLELQQEAAAATAATAPVVRAAPDRFSLASSNGQTFIRLRGVLNVDNRSFGNGLAPSGSALAPGSNGFVLRQVRPLVEGTLGGFVDFRLMPDFAGGRAIVQDAYLVVRFKPWFAVTAGKFKAPFGLERLQGDTDTRFIERALPDRLVPNRDIGVQVSGELKGGLLAYQAAWLNGAADGGSSDGNSSPDSDNNDQKDLALRVFALPFRDTQLFALRGLGVGLGASFADQRGTVDATGAAVQSLLPGYRTNGQQTFAAYRGGTTPTLAWGRRTRLSPQAYYYYGPFGALAEYVTVDQDVRRVNGTSIRQDTLHHQAWQFGVAWSVTGEDEGYRVAVPKQPFVPGGPGWGSLELTARIAALAFDADAFDGGANSYANPVGNAARARAWTLGANWGLTQNFKLLLNYERTDFTAAAGFAAPPAEKLLLTRFQLQY